MDGSLGESVDMIEFDGTRLVASAPRRADERAASAVTFEHLALDRIGYWRLDGASVASATGRRALRPVAKRSFFTCSMRRSELRIRPGTDRSAAARLVFAGATASGCPCPSLVRGIFPSSRPIRLGRR